MFDKLLNLIFDADGDLKFGVGITALAICIILAGIVQGM